MYKITKATIVKNGKPVMSFDMDKDVRADRLEDCRRRIKSRYVKAVLAEIQVDLQYKEVGDEIEK